MKRAIVDVDGTLWDLHARIGPVLNKLYGVPLGYPDKWEYYKNLAVREDYCTDKQFFAVVNETHQQQGAQPEFAVPFEGAGKLIYALSKKHEIIIASHRQSNSVYWLVEWLNYWVAPVWSGVYAGHNKTFMIGEGDLVIDDNPSTIEYALSQRAISWALLWPWNKDTDGHKFTSLGEMVECVNDE